MTKLLALWRRLRKAIRDARNPKSVKRPPLKDGDSVQIYVRPQDGPVVETKHAVLPLSRVPLLSEKANAKRIALAYARKRTGNPELSWKSARRLLNAWERAERFADDGARTANPYNEVGDEVLHGAHSLHGLVTSTPAKWPAP